MISISIDKAITLYFALVVGLIFLAWAIHLIRSKKKKPLIFPSKVHKCEYCSSAYMEKDWVKTSRCPTCGSYNKN